MASDEERIRIKVGMSISHAANADYEDVHEGPSRAEWDRMSEKDRAQYLDDLAEVMLSNQISMYAYVEED